MAFCTLANILEKNFSLPADKILRMKINLKFTEYQLKPGKPGMFRIKPPVKPWNTEWNRDYG